MAKLPKVRQRVDCVLPGYEEAGIYVDVWVNAPNRITEQWAEMVRSARVLDEKGNQAFELDAEGNPRIDPKTFEPIPAIDQSKLIEAANFYVRSLVLEFSLTEDEDGEPLDINDEDFWERLPEDIIIWLQQAISDSIAERRNQGKSGAKLQGIIGR